jgi:hypothetical protein
MVRINIEVILWVSIKQVNHHRYAARLLRGKHTGGDEDRQQHAELPAGRPPGK